MPVILLGQPIRCLFLLESVLTVGTSILKPWGELQFAAGFSPLYPDARMVMHNRACLLAKQVG
jgi:hypothetical protein